MEFFLDTADLNELRTGIGWGMVDGATTNPSLVAKQGKRYLDAVKEVAELVPGPVSGEVWRPTTTPSWPSAQVGGAGQERRGQGAAHPGRLARLPALRGEGTQVNVTLCFSAAQALLAAKADATYISPFVGRLDDVGQDGMELIDEVVTIYRAYGFKTKVLVASVRHPIHVTRPPRWAPRWRPCRSRCSSSSTSTR